MVDVTPAGISRHNTPADPGGCCRGIRSATMEMHRVPAADICPGTDHNLAFVQLGEAEIVGRSTRDGSVAVGKPHTPNDLLATISHTLFDYSEARLVPDVPFELRKALADIEKMPGIL